MADLVPKLRAAEERQAALLAEMNALDGELGQLTPADPRRADLKAKKSEVLTRYQGVKSTVKQLRRQINAGDWRPPEKVEAEADVAEDVDEDEILDTLRNVAIKLIDRAHSREQIELDGDDLEALEDFVAWMEHGT